MNWEFELLSAIQMLHHPWLDQIMVFVTSLANHGELWIALGLLFLCFARTRRLGMNVLISIVLGYVTGNLILKNLFARSRPCWVRPDVSLLVAAPKDYSFPSGHTLVSFEGAVSIFRYKRSWGIAAIALAAVIAFSRLYLFVHFPTDILGGLVLGTVNAWAGERLGQVISHKKNSRTLE